MEGVSRRVTRGDVRPFSGNWGDFRRSAVIFFSSSRSFFCLVASSVELPLPEGLEESGFGKTAAPASGCSATECLQSLHWVCFLDMGEYPGHRHEGLVQLGTARLWEGVVTLAVAWFFISLSCGKKFLKFLCFAVIILLRSIRP